MSQEVDGIDLARMRRARRERLVAALAAEDAAALLLLGQANVAYAAGATSLQVDASRSPLERALALLVAGDPYPHLFTPWPEGVPDDYPADRVHEPVFPESANGAADLLRQVAALTGVGTGDRLLVDEMPSALYAELPRALPGVGIDDGVRLVAAARRTKTIDEIACARHAQQINEAAMAHVQPMLASGLPPARLTAEFLARAFDAGAEACVVEPIWQVMPRAAADGPFSLKGGPAFPLPTSDEPLADGDVIWVDSGIAFSGYHSDFGRTWLVGESPTDRQHDQFHRWRDVIDAVLAETRPGATGRMLTTAARKAAGGETPWLPHLYLGHGMGLNSAETPLIGTDLGDDFDDQQVLEVGTVFVLEPVIWDDGHAGYRSEEVVAVTDDGYQLLSDYPYDPYA
jgi:Xaa-Pro dipeptidase